MHTISPFLWFDNQAAEAMHFYTSIFKNSKVLEVSHYGEGGPGPAGDVMVASFELNGQKFMALNGGPQFKFTEAVSFLIDCKDQAEVDYYWSKLGAGGSEGQCGWIQDKFGLWWQVVPDKLPELLGADDREKAGRAMAVMLKMQKLDVDALQRAFDGK